MTCEVFGASTTIALLLLVGAATAHAQVDRATLTGIVKDPSDAVIEKAQVKVTSLAPGDYLVVQTCRVQVQRFRGHNEAN